MAFGGTVKLTGESEYKKALADITGNLKVLNSEMKLVTSQYDKNDKSTESLTQQNDVLNKKIAEQKEKVDVLSKALADAEQETGENSKTTQKWQIELNNAQAELNKLVKEVGDNEKAMEQSADATEENADSVEKFGKEADESGKKALSLGDIIKANLISEGIMSGLSALGGAISGIGEKFGAFLELGESTKETQTAMAKLEASFKSAGHEMDYAVDTVYSLTGVLGDMDRSVEASNLLAKMSKDGKDLEANTRILTGVFAEFGDSIPTEGLAEGMQATAEMGSVQGVLADALEWQGINLDDYNAKLESMTSAEERASYIQSTLTDLYGASADAYRENNQALIESNEAQLRYEQHLADMGEMALPLQTNIKNISSTLMGAFLPALDSVMPSIQAISGEFTNLIKAVVRGDEEGGKQAFYMISEGITDLINGLEDAIPMVSGIVSDLVTTMLDLIEEYLPWIVEEGMLMLSSLLSGIGDNIVSIIPTVMTVIETLITTIVTNLPMVLETGIQMLVSIITGISSMLPDLIPLMVNTVILLTETLLDNIDLIIDAGIEIILALVDGLIYSTPELLAELPVLISKVVSAIVSNLPRILAMGVELIVKLTEGIIASIPYLLSQIPMIYIAIVGGITQGIGKITEVGADLVKGVWNGIKDTTSWLLEKIKGFGQSVLNGIKSIFGIHSPSTLFRDEVGKNLALGVGEGFADTMADVSADMSGSIPTEFDTNVNANFGTVGTTSNYDMMVMAFKQALTEVKVEMNGREMGAFVEDRMERLVYA